MPASPVIHWFRRDLRLSDNPALHAAAETGSDVIPVYVLSSWKTQHGWTGPARQQFLLDSLDSLARNLEAQGSRLILRAGDAAHELRRLVQQTGARALFFNRDYDPFGRAMEQRIQSVCRKLGIECHSYQERVLHEPDAVLTGSGDPYRVFTPYSRNWLNQTKPQPVPRPQHLGSVPSNLDSLPHPTLAYWSLPATTATLPVAGERAARDRMKAFLQSDRLTGYQTHRDTPAGQTTSGLSQDLRFGLIGIRELYHRCTKVREQVEAKARPSIDTYIKELAWREFYQAILFHYPHVFEEEFNPDWRGLPWPGTEQAFNAWAAGRTGFPIVDAGMRQLLATGLMHNRVRMIVSMFLTKDLHCDWRLGESFFMQHLIDGENASNNGGWQWSSGTGADAAPYFRIQNPWTQSQRYDPDGSYIRRWVPELAGVSAARLTAPPKDGRPIAPGYPSPMVDHATERDRTLARFKRHRHP
ncbi:MAG: deoxyribodipyrimidine photo-lyase [Verrucomicrobiales bacterium]|nr:deoxyribodipyrimidine photo-lyase [Verrucomicrobiales bacterium]